MSHLAKAAGQKSRILVIDHIVSPVEIKSEGPTAAESLAALTGKTEYVPIQPPPYIPSNFGMANLFPLELSVTMTAAFNGEC